MNIKVCALVIQLAVLYMVIPQTSGWWFVKDIVKQFCGFFWEFVCPAGVAAGGAAAAVGSAGTGAAAAAAGVVAGTATCHLVKKSTCKRTSPTDLEEYAFPDQFEDYDMNRDGQIEYEEFVFMLMSLLPMEQPEEIRGPFEDVDINKNGRIDRDEWEKAPLIFRHPTDAGIESLRVDGGVETQLPDKRYYGRPYGYGYAGFRK